MSRRMPNAAAEHTAQNAQIIKSLLKLEGNKTCADCKRNKHPRWASWNIGVFICIRCSGIHRGMGTHISRVKSVDLDSWTDEQVQSALKWGNTKANKYWEAKLAAGHVPSESKMENFIRTKYESKRWVMEGPMPDPSTLEVDGDDDVPLSLVKEKQTIHGSSSKQNQTPGPSHIKRAPQPDLFGDDSTTKASAASKTIAKVGSTPVKQTKPADSLLGLDFFGTETSPPSRPSSTVSTLGSINRPDLKQSILSLYASTTRPQQQQPQSPQSSIDTFGSMQPMTSLSGRKTSSGAINDAFSSLNLSSHKSYTVQSQTKASSFSSSGNSFHKSTPSQTSLLGGGTFFETKSPQKPTQQLSSELSSSNSFGVFESVTSTLSTTNTTNSSTRLGEMFDFVAPAPQSSASKPKITSPSAQNTSVFNLSQNPPTKTSSSSANTDAWSTSDTWVSSNAWNDGTKTNPGNPSISSPSKVEDPGWGAPIEPPPNPSTVIGGASGNGFVTANGPSKVSADEDFGGWSSAAPVAPANGITTTSKPAAGFAGSDDLFSNVWG